MRSPGTPATTKPFGAGTHRCPGRPLARTELRVVHPTLCRRIPALRGSMASANSRSPGGPALSAPPGRS
ncbi:cytochrome P450 [Streptomyces flaveolus]|uniref:cytochrome P450 n=1 Tax=Streptomyces flaveolus TaxID=67297 RepID=UPI003F5414B6